jgi:hypothetical protein
VKARTPGATASLIVAAVFALMLIALVVTLPLVADRWRDAAFGEPPTLDAVETVADLELTHTDEDVDYPHSPPVGGPHDEVWLACGEYDEPVRDENAVHALEHGTVWITYEPGLSSDDVAELEDRLPAEGILSPYPGQEAPVEVTVWGAQLELEGVDDERLGLFLAEYGDGHTSPEPMASCEGGQRVFAGGGVGTAA